MSRSRCSCLARALEGARAARKLQLEGLDATRPSFQIGSLRYEGKHTRWRLCRDLAIPAVTAGRIGSHASSGRSLGCGSRPPPPPKTAPTAGREAPESKPPLARGGTAGSRRTPSSLLSFSKARPSADKRYLDLHATPVRLRVVSSPESSSRRSNVIASRTRGATALRVPNGAFPFSRVE